MTRMTSETTAPRWQTCSPAAARIRTSTAHPRRAEALPAATVSLALRPVLGSCGCTKPPQHSSREGTDPGGAGGDAKYGGTSWLDATSSQYFLLNGQQLFQPPPGTLEDAVAIRDKPGLWEYGQQRARGVCGLALASDPGGLEAHSTSSGDPGAHPLRSQAQIRWDVISGGKKAQREGPSRSSAPPGHPCARKFASCALCPSRSPSAFRSASQSPAVSEEPAENDRRGCVPTAAGTFFCSTTDARSGVWKGFHVDEPFLERRGKSQGSGQPFDPCFRGDRGVGDRTEILSFPALTLPCSRPREKSHEQRAKHIRKTRVHKHKEPAKTFLRSLLKLKIQTILQGRRLEAWKECWFVLWEGKTIGGLDVLQYHQNDHDSKPLGSINLQSCEQVDVDVTRKELHGNYMFDIKTSERTFYLMAETWEERNKWVQNIAQICGFTEIEKTTVRFRTKRWFDSAWVDPVYMKNVSFEHVKGVDEAKQKLQEVVEFLKNPLKFTVLGCKLPKGILLVGPPGTGKTLLAQAMAGEADVPFYYVSGSEFDEMFLGLGACRIRNLFREAKANAPCIVCIDELDSVGGKRIQSPMDPYSRQTINQLLAEMDCLKCTEGVIIIGATNFPEALDNAFIHPGRFDMQVTVLRPDVRGRTEILKWYLNKIKFDESVDPEIIAQCTEGFSGAELENLVNQAVLLATADGKEMVSMKELEFSRDKIIMGPERRSVEIDNKNKTITAYHESGHAIIACYTEGAMPINKVTIVPRGSILGEVSLLPENDKWNESRTHLLAQMDVSMGGRVAEELIFGIDYITTGASIDFDYATKIAKRIVTKFGMNEKLGVGTYSNTGTPSPETQSAIEQEIRILHRDSYERAKHILKTHAEEHKNLAEALLTYETLDAKEIQIVLEGKKLEMR
ncbi:ATP-dependent zinc metalloprotease YME1L1-like [Otolemur garnettii]|uniref:ATP-dependent zinc metalloprotease YME1L1-like n=1 Tax=Otolemur garnettii TaxID=30611 RepID=UPI00064443B4|nr:ATP-dependent zinc metalloprotease YME1L1-like [Otolemur garnettii]